MRNIFALIGATTLMTGCMNIGPVRYPEPTANFVPKRTYSVPLGVALTKVESTLDEARIPIATQSKTDTSTRIQTDFVEGQSQLIAGGLVASQSTRYRYSVILRPVDERTTTINIVCNVESTMNGRAGVSQWTDVSGQNKALVSNLEGWLYEQIERNL